MGAPLLEQFLPEVGSARGCPQLLVGPKVGRASGAPAFLLSVDDRRTGRPRLALFVDLPPTVAGLLRSAGPATGPVWPLLVPVGPGQVAWDGLTSVEGAVAVRVAGTILSWVADPVGHQVCVTAAHGPGTPDQLLDTLRTAGIVTGWASAAQHERRWLIDNVARVAPGIHPPAEAQPSELQAGLAVLAGFSDPVAMVATGGYRPSPHVADGALTLARVRTTWRPQLLLEGRASLRVGPHRTGPGSLPALLQEGRLLSLRAARLTGGARSTWTAYSTGQVGLSHVIELEVDGGEVTLMPPPSLIWDHPDRLLDRLDAAALGSPAQTVRAPGTTAAMAPLDPTGRVLDSDVSWPSLLLEAAIDLFGPYGPDRLIVRDAQEQAEVIATLRSRGVEALQSRWVEDAVQVHPALTDR